jgi:hypothetical protein
MSPCRPEQLNIDATSGVVLIAKLRQHVDLLWLLDSSVSLALHSSLLREAFTKPAAKSISHL